MKVEEKRKVRVVPIEVSDAGTSKGAPIGTRGVRGTRP